MGLGRVGFFFLFFFSISAQAFTSEWTIFVYVAGDEAALEESSRQALMRLTRTPALRPDGKVRVVAQWDNVGEDPNYRYLLREGDLTPLTEKEISSQLGKPFHYAERDSGDAKTLRDFLAWGKRAYPARHYGLILSGHSWGRQGMMQDYFVPGVAGDSMMKNPDIRRALEATGGLDFLLIDACIAGQLDVALEFESVTKYFAASSLETPYHSVPFDKVLDPFLKAVEHSPYTDALLEDYFFKPWVRQFLRSHSRYGELVAAEGQIDPVDAFAVRTEHLGEVSRALKNAISALPQKTSLDAKWALLADDDDNLDLAQLTESLRHYIPDPIAKELRRALGYPSKDVGLRQTVVDFRERPEAKGAWAVVQIDETARHRETAICSSLKAFATLNAGQPDLVPQLSENGRLVAASELDCVHLAEAFQEDHPHADLPNPDGGPHPLLEVFGREISWPSDHSGYFIETARKDRITGRALVFWIPRRAAATRKVRLALVGTEKIEIHYSKEEKEIRYVAPYTIHDRFSRDGLYVVEGHSNGAPFKHGLGILFSRELPAEEILEYRRLRIAETGWPEFLFGP